MSPSHSARAFLQSLIPAEVLSLKEIKPVWYRKTAYERWDMPVADDTGRCYNADGSLAARVYTNCSTDTVTGLKRWEQPKFTGTSTWGRVNASGSEYWAYLALNKSLAGYSTSSTDTQWILSATSGIFA